MKTLLKCVLVFILGVFLHDFAQTKNYAMVALDFYDRGPLGQDHSIYGFDQFFWNVEKSIFPASFYFNEMDLKKGMERYFSAKQFFDNGSPNSDYYSCMAKKVYRISMNSDEISKAKTDCR